MLVQRQIEEYVFSISEKGGWSEFTHECDITIDISRTSHTSARSTRGPHEPALVQRASTFANLGLNIFFITNESNLFS